MRKYSRLSKWQATWMAVMQGGERSGCGMQLGNVMGVGIEKQGSDGHAKV